LAIPCKEELQFPLLQVIPQDVKVSLLVTRGCLVDFDQIGPFKCAHFLLGLGGPGAQGRTDLHVDQRGKCQRLNPTLNTLVVLAALGVLGGWFFPGALGVADETLESGKFGFLEPTLDDLVSPADDFGFGRGELVDQAIVDELVGRQL
jgi:hypothetical protein